MNNVMNIYLKFLKTEEVRKLNENLDIRNKFVKLFDKKKILEISKDYYVVGKGNENSFCYILEYGEGQVLGSIKGGSANKFSLYYSKKYAEYIYDEDKFNSSNDAIEKIRKELYKISNLDEVEELEELDILKDVFKRKVFYMYNSEKIIPIFSSSTLTEKAKEIFGIEGSYSDIQKKLLELYNNIDSSNKNTYNFMVFIYKYCENKDFLKDVIAKKDIFLPVSENLNAHDEIEKADKETETKLEKQNRYIELEKFKLEKFSFEENMKMKRIAFNIVISLMGFEILCIFILFNLVGFELLKYSDIQLNIFIGATITQITLIFFWIIKYLFPNKNNEGVGKK